jgi:hypothetical protein
MKPPPILARILPTGSLPIRALAASTAQRPGALPGLLRTSERNRQLALRGGRRQAFELKPSAALASHVAEDPSAR